MFWKNAHVSSFSSEQSVSIKSAEDDISKEREGERHFFEGERDGGRKKGKSERLKKRKCVLKTKDKS